MTQSTLERIRHPQFCKALPASDSSVRWKVLPKPSNTFQLFGENTTPFNERVNEPVAVFERSDSRIIPVSSGDRPFGMLSMLPLRKKCSQIPVISERINGRLGLSLRVVVWLLLLLLWICSVLSVREKNEPSLDLLTVSALLGLAEIMAVSLSSSSAPSKENTFTIELQGTLARHNQHRHSFSRPVETVVWMDSVE